MDELDELLESLCWDMRETDTTRASRAAISAHVASLVAAERERCAVVCEQYAAQYVHAPLLGEAATSAAYLIRRQVP